jgi:hypothetical protein
MTHCFNSAANAIYCIEQYGFFPYRHAQNAVSSLGEQNRWVALEQSEIQAMTIRKQPANWIAARRFIASSSRVVGVCPYRHSPNAVRHSRGIQKRWIALELRCNSGDDEEERN